MKQILKGAAVGFGLQALGGAGSVLGTIRQRRQAKRAQNLLDTTYRDTSSTQGAARGFRTHEGFARTADTRKFQDELARAKASGVSPTLLNQRRKFYMDRQAETAALSGMQAELLAREQLGATRAELTQQANVPTAGDRLMQGMNLTAPLGAQIGGAVATKEPKKPTQDTTDQVVDVDNSFAEPK
jgi:hypothetical protein